MSPPTVVVLWYQDGIMALKYTMVLKSMYYGTSKNSMVVLCYISKIFVYTFFVNVTEVSYYYHAFGNAL